MRELKSPGGIVFTRPSEDSSALQSLLINTCVVPILRWSEEAERQGALGSYITQLRNDLKDCRMAAWLAFLEL